MQYSHEVALPGNTIEVACDDGYTIVGPGHIKCQQDETFDVTTFPSCRC